MLKGLGALSARTLNGKRILDLGAGECLMTLALASHFSPLSLWAVDAVPKQIWAAHRYASMVGLPIRTMLASAYDLPFPDGCFDVVLMSGVVHHLPNPALAFSEISRLLCPGGTLHCHEPNPNVWIAQMYRRISANERAIGLRRVAGLMQEAGLAVIERRYRWARFDTSFMGSLSPSYRVVARKPGTGAATNAAQDPLPGRAEPTDLAGLLLDRDAPFRDAARSQIARITAFISRANPKLGCGVHIAARQSASTTQPK